MQNDRFEKINVGLIGYGIGKLLGWSLMNVPRYYKEFSSNDIKIFGVCTSSESSSQKAKKELGCEFTTSDYKELILHPKINAIFVGVPDHLHFPVVDAVISSNKPYYCEKPLTRTFKEAQLILEKSKKSTVHAQMGFQMRFGSAVQQAKKLLSEGVLGQLFTFRCTYQHSGYENPDKPMSWRLDETKAGGGALFDLGSHAIDLIRFLLGDFDKVVAQQGTYIKSRPVSGSNSEFKDVNVDDVSFALCMMKNGVQGTLEATRLASGIRQGPEITIHGSNGSIRLNGYTNPHILDLYLNEPKNNISKSGFETIIFDNGVPTPLEVVSVHSFLSRLRGVNIPIPSINDGYEVQKILEALRLSSLEHSWKSI